MVREEGWNLRDSSRAPIRRNYKLSNKEKEEVVRARKKEPWCANTLKYNLVRKGIHMSDSTIKRIIKKAHLFTGSVMEGKQQTTGKVERLIGTIKKERIRRIDLEHTRYVYNTHRPHQSRDSLYPCELYFQIRTIPIIL